jgi:hypothetical protein
MAKFEAIFFLEITMTTFCDPSGLGGLDSLEEDWASLSVSDVRSLSFNTIEQLYKTYGELFVGLFLEKCHVGGIISDNVVRTFIDVIDVSTFKHGSGMERMFLIMYSEDVMDDFVDVYSGVKESYIEKDRIRVEYALVSYFIRIDFLGFFEILEKIGDLELFLHTKCLIETWIKFHHGQWIPSLKEPRDEVIHLLGKFQDEYITRSLLTMISSNILDSIMKSGSVSALIVYLGDKSKSGRKRVFARIKNSNPRLYHKVKKMWDTHK